METRGGGKPQQQSPVDFGPVVRQPPQHRLAGWGQVPGQGAHAVARKRPGGPHHRHAGAAGMACERENSGRRQSYLPSFLTMAVALSHIAFWNF